MPLQMKYFVLKPRAKAIDDAFAEASQNAMTTYANVIRFIDPELAQQLKTWAREERVRQGTMERPARL